MQEENLRARVANYAKTWGASSPKSLAFAFVPSCYFIVGEYNGACNMCDTSFRGISRIQLIIHSCPFSGASDSKYNPKFHCSRNLCSQCKGRGRAKCSRSRIEPYYGYQGAFQCLKDGAGDVAFIKESILTSLSDEEQAKYKLLCKDNTRKGERVFKRAFIYNILQ